MNTDKTKRRQKKLNELETVNPNCQICGQSEVTSLKRTALSVKQVRLLEIHHITGGHNGETIIVCFNCHTKLTDDQLEWPEGTLSSNRTQEMKAVTFFMAMTTILILLAGYCAIHAKTLYDFVIKYQNKEGKPDERTISLSN